MSTSSLEWFLRTFWNGDSTLDAWFNIASIRLSSRLLSFPQATVALGLPSAIVFQVLQAAIGLWWACMINILYLRHRNNTIQTRRHGCHTAQLHEVIGSLLGPRWGTVSLILNIGYLFPISSYLLGTCSNIVYIINDNLDKRTWTLIFGAIFSLSILIPTAQNYRMWSFLGVITSLYTCCYLTIASLVYGKRPSLRHSYPHSYQDYFSGAAGYIILGHILVPVEIMDAMSKPEEFPTVYFRSSVYMFIMVMSSTISIYFTVGDEAHKKINALELFPATTFRNAAAVLMLLHQFITFGVFSLGIHTMWEKLVGVHNASTGYIKRTLCRIPVFLALWLAALAFPSFAKMGKMLSCTLVAWGVYVIPCAAYNVYFFRVLKNSTNISKSFSRLGWAVDFSINLGVILWVVIVESGLGFWGSLKDLLGTNRPHLFERCYSC